MQEADHRVYIDNQGIETIQLGCGGIVISDLYANDGSFSGISFSIGTVGTVIDSDVPNIHGKSCEELESVLKIIATKPESLDVLIEQITKARDNFGKSLIELHDDK